MEVDEIYNLACPASPIHYQLHPVQTTKTCVHGSINMLGLAKRLGIRILQASTSEVYGDPTVQPQAETYWGNVNPIGPRSCYDEGKRCARDPLLRLPPSVRPHVRVARIFNTYGPRMLPNDGRVVSNFIVQALSRRPLTVYGRGDQTRSFCYVTDLVEGLARLMALDDDDTGPVNLGNPREITIEALARMVIEQTGADVDIVHEPLPEDDPVRRQPDVGLARGLLDWEPTVSSSRRAWHGRWPTSPVRRLKAWVERSRHRLVPSVPSTYTSSKNDSPQNHIVTNCPGRSCGRHSPSRPRSHARIGHRSPGGRNRSGRPASMISEEHQPQLALDGVDASSADVFRALRRTFLLQRQLMEKALAAKGSHPGEAMCVRLLDEHEGMSQRDLADILHLSRPRVTAILQRLEKAGAVARRADEHDQRLTRVALTAEGRRLAEELRAVFVTCITPDDRRPDRKRSPGAGTTAGVPGREHGPRPRSSMDR